MQVLVYGRTFQVGGADIRQELQAVVCEQQMEVCGELSALCSCLRRTGNPYALAVLICATRDDLLQVSSIAHLLLDLRIVLIVPDLDEATVAIGHRLFPRYLASMDAGLEEVMGVLRKLLNGSARMGA
jgi:hypothetical protein